MNTIFYKITTVLFSLFFLLNVNAQNSSFILGTDSFSNYFPGYTGNGLFSLSTTKLATDPAESYMAWVYDHGKDDIPRIAKIPAWNAVDFFNGSDWLNKTAIDDKHIQNFHQEINMSDGVIKTSYNWKDGQKITIVEVKSFTSRSNPNAAAIKFTFVPQFSGKIKLLASLSGWNQPDRQPLAKLKKNCTCSRRPMAFVLVSWIYEG